MEERGNEATVQSVDHNGDAHTVPVDQLAWRPSAYAVLTRGESVLAVPHLDDAGNNTGYDLPGGGVELGEMFETAVIRETWEETGLQVVEPQLLGMQSTFFTMLEDDCTVQSVMAYYACRISGGELSNQHQEAWERTHMAAPEWLSVQALSKIAVASSADWRPYARQAISEQTE